MEALMRVCEAVADVATLEVVGQALGIVEGYLIVDAVLGLDAGETDRLADLMAGIQKMTADES